MIRKIPEERIKVLNGIFILPEGYTDAHANRFKDFIIQDAGREIATKLAEFCKFRRIGNKIIHEIEIIVPETPENPWPPKT